MTDADVILEEAVEEGRLVTLAEVKAMLEKAQKDRAELTYEQKIALEHAKRFARVDTKVAKAISKGIQEAMPGIAAEMASEIFLAVLASTRAKRRACSRAIFCS